MSRFWRQIAFILFLAIALTGITAAPALAAGSQSGGTLCTGNNLVIPSGQSVDTVLAFGCNITLEQGATVRGDFVDFGSNSSIAGTVDGKIITFGGNISLESTGVVHGSISSVGGNVTSAAGAVVQGGVNQNTGQAPQPITPPVFAVNPFTRSFNFGIDILGVIVTALAFAALGALVVIFAPNATRRVSDAVQAKPFNTAGVGCLTLILLPILGLLLLITLIGIPVAFLLAIVAGIAWIFGGIGIGLLAGEKILKAFRARDILPVLAVVIGILILMIVGQIPIVGWLVSCVVGLLGLGAVVLTRFGTRVYPTPPTMMLAPAAIPAAGPPPPGTYTPSAVDTAAWEARARSAQSRDVPPTPADEPPAANIPPPSSDVGPATGSADAPKPDM